MSVEYDDPRNDPVVNPAHHHEYLEVLDEKGNKTGTSLPRSEVHRKGLWHRCVHVWIVNSKGELIIQKRAACKESWPNCWDISSAGHVTAGDDSITTAIKELEEELGIKTSANDLEFLFTSTVDSTLRDGKYINREFCDVYLLTMDAELSKLVLQVEEVSEVKYIHFEDLQQVFLDNTDPSYVPCDLNTNYKILFDTLRSRYGKIQ